MIKLKIEEEFETIRTIIRQKASIARLGDGELKVLLGKNAVGQDSSKELVSKLKVILNETVDNLLVGVPRAAKRYDLLWVNEKSYNMHKTFLSRADVMMLFNPSKQYYSTFMTRPDCAIQLDCQDYWTLCSKMWAKRNVLVLHGGGKPKLGLYTESNIFKNTKSVNFIKASPHNAFSEYDRIMEQVCTYPKDTLVYMALGVAATILAYDLHKLGYQALDMGHFGMFYGRAHSKAHKWRCVNSCLTGINFQGKWWDR